MQPLIMILAIIYLGSLGGSIIGIKITNHLSPKGLWKLVPFRISGWKSASHRNKIYRQNWVWQDLDLEDYYYE